MYFPIYLIITIIAALVVLFISKDPMFPTSIKRWTGLGVLGYYFITMTVFFFEYFEWEQGVVFWTVMGILGTPTFFCMLQPLVWFIKLPPYDN